MKQLQRIKELETELVKLRLETRHIDFIKDYDRSLYIKEGYLSGAQVEPFLLSFLQKLDEPIKYDELIKTLVQQIPNLSEADFEKTGSGNIRIYSAIRSKIEQLAKQKKIEKPERGMLQLTRRSNSLEEISQKAVVAKSILENLNSKKS